MKEQYYETEALDRAAIQSLMTRSDQPALFRFTLQFTLFVVSSIIVISQYGQNWWLWGTAFVVEALLITSMFAIGHETVHRTAFKNKTLNEIAGALACFTVFYIPEWFRQFHFAHHRHTHHPELDPEIAPFGKPAPLTTSGLPLYVSFLSGFPLLSFKIGLMMMASLPMSGVLIAKLMPYVKPKAFHRMQWQARFYTLTYVGLATIGYLYWPMGLLLFFVSQVVGHGILSVFLVAEHGGLPHKGSILERTRTTHTNRLVRFLMWNMPYHAEHHAYPAVPWHALPALNKLMTNELVNADKGYPTFHGRVVSELVQGRAYQEKKVLERRMD